MTDFAAIDFETANGQRSSVCSVGVVVVRHGAAASFGHGVQLVVGELSAEMAARGAAGAKERIVGIVHLVNFEHRLETAFVKRAVVRH